MPKFSDFFTAAPSQETKPAARGKTSAGRNQPAKLDDQLTLGERIYHFLEDSYGLEYAADYATVRYPRSKGSISAYDRREDDLPRGFLRDFVEDILGLIYSDSYRTRCRRALWAYLDRVGSQPTMTRIAARGTRKGNSCRSSGGAYNALKGGGGLQFALLQWFVDVLQGCKLRVDSSMLLEKAREMRQFLIDEHGLPASDLPLLESDNTGYQWLHRWRISHNLSKKYHWNRLKVSWAKIKRRVRTYLTTIFR